MNLKTNYIDSVEYARIILNNQLNEAREKFSKDKNQLNKKEYIELIEDMRRINLLDKKTVKKYYSK